MNACSVADVILWEGLGGLSFLGSFQVLKAMLFPVGSHCVSSLSISMSVSLSLSFLFDIEFKDNKIICLVKEILRQNNTQAVAWLMLTVTILVYSETEQK